VCLIAIRAVSGWPHYGAVADAVTGAGFVAVAVPVVTELVRLFQVWKAGRKMLDKAETFEQAAKTFQMFAGTWGGPDDYDDEPPDDRDGRSTRELLP
jgi:hypothetical protein